MRLSNHEINIIKNSIFKYIDDAKIKLFGSRVYDYKKGGDIDIYVETLSNVSLLNKIKILTDIEIAGITRKVDLVIKTPKSKFQSIFATIEKEGVAL